jgi:plastocyanin
MPPARHTRFNWLLFAACFINNLGAQTPDVSRSMVDVIARLGPAPLDATHKAEKQAPAVIWLNPLRPSAMSFAPRGNFTLLQKDKMFTPHLLVVPVGSSVAFPNADPFFHNVFSLFDGRRFDLGLYEAGSTRSVVFSREGVSYIFCNIHSEMSAVVIALVTPHYAVADPHGAFHLIGVPSGDYELHVWIEGRRQSVLDRLTRRVHVTGEIIDLGEISAGPPEQRQHLNKFGQAYEPDSRPIY